MHPQTRNSSTGLELHRGVEQLAARQAHNLEVASSNPASATKVNGKVPENGTFFVSGQLQLGQNSDIVEPVGESSGFSPTKKSATINYGYEITAFVDDVHAFCFEIVGRQILFDDNHCCKKWG